MFPLEQIAHIVGGDLHATSPDDLRLHPAGICHDSRRINAGDLFVALPGARTDGRRFIRSAFSAGACGAMLSPAADMDPRELDAVGPWIEVSDPLQALTCLASAWRRELDATIIAITGTNGKTTTRELLAHVLSAVGLTHASPDNLNTEIGVPLSVLLAPRDARYGVFEAAADRPGDLAPLNDVLQPDLVILTGIGRGHLDRLDSLDAVANEKWQLVRTRPEAALAMVNGDDERLWSRVTGAADPGILTFGLNREACDQFAEVLAQAPALSVRIRGHEAPIRCPLLGRHNAINLLAATSAAERLGIPRNLIAQRAATFDPPPHRLVLHRNLPWGDLLDDSYNANPDSTLAALDVLESLTSGRSERTVVFGEMQGLGQFASEGHRVVADRIASLGVSAVFAVGSSAIDAASRHPGLACSASEPSLEEMASALRTHMRLHPGVLLIKGSHSLGLDRLADDLAGDKKATAGVADDPHR